MAYLNKVLLIGNLGKDPEIRMTPTGRKKAAFSFATTFKWRDQSGEQKERTDWHNIVAWGKAADRIEALQVRKGTSLYIEGRISYRSWDDPTSGQKKYATDIEMDEFQFLTPKTQGGGGYNAGGNNGGNNGGYAGGQGGGYNGGAAQGRGPAQPPAYDAGPEYDTQGSGPDDDLPF